MSKSKTSSQIISRRRVADHGEVFTAEREVKAMCDLVKSETERIDSRFLEPACGQGAFLTEILTRKLAVVSLRFASRQSRYEQNAVIAVSSIYGIDILPDNVEKCRQNLFDIFEREYSAHFKTACNDTVRRCVRRILKLNILCGDALTLKTPVLPEAEEGSSGKTFRKTQAEKPIVFAEWSFTGEGMVKRRDYTLANLLENQPVCEPNLFSDLGDRAFVPHPVKEYPLVHFLKIGEP